MVSHVSTNEGLFVTKMSNMIIRAPSRCVDYLTAIEVLLNKNDL